MAIGAGACIALQAAANGNFRHNLQSPAWAAFFSICGTILVACLGMLFLRPEAPSMESVRATPWWNWVGGPLGALIVLAGATLTREMGAAPFVACVVGGQLLCSVLLDHFGLMGLTVVPATFGKFLGVALIVAGVVCVKFL